VTEQQIKEQLSRSYIELLINRGGFKQAKLDVDHGVDLYITRAQRRVRNGVARYFDTLEFIGVQLKCTCLASVEELNDHIVFDLEAKTYNDLVDSVQEKSSTPLFLVLMVLPDDAETWVEVREHEIVLAKCAYWYRPSETDLPTTNTATRRILIPLANKLDLGFIEQQFAAFF
jgi:hypothetical protein